MTAAKFIQRLSEIADRYEGLLCDAWGVIHDGVCVFAGVEEALTKFRATRGPVVVLTNAPRPSEIIPPQLDRVGLSRGAYDSVVTSGDATRAAIEKFSRRPAFKLGPAKDEALYKDMNVSWSPLEKAEFIVCTGLVDDDRESPDDYADLLDRASARRLPMICANPDIVVRWGGRLIYCAGALAAAYEQRGGDVIYGGKPHRPIYDLAFLRLEEAAGRVLDRRRVLAVGDGPKTDILGAERCGIDALFVVHEGGVHEGDATEETVAASLAEAGAAAKFWSTEFRW